MISSLVHSYARLIATGLEEIRRIEAEGSAPKTSIKTLKTSVSYNIRWMSIDGLFDASEAAIAMFAGKIDLHKLKYTDQIRAEKKIDPSIKRRTILKLEHKTCVSDIFKQISESDGTAETIAKILLSMECVWILVEEDRRLKVSHRGADHSQIYEVAGIKVVKNPAASHNET